MQKTVVLFKKDHAVYPLRRWYPMEMAGLAYTSPHVSSQPKQEMEERGEERIIAQGRECYSFTAPIKAKERTPT